MNRYIEHAIGWPQKQIVVHLNKFKIKINLKTTIVKHKTTKQHIQQIVRNDISELYEKQFIVQENEEQPDKQQEKDIEMTFEAEEEISDDIPYNQSLYIKQRTKIPVSELNLSLIKKNGKQFAGKNEVLDCSEIQYERINRYRKEQSYISNIIQHIYLSSEDAVNDVEQCKKLNISFMLSLNQQQSNISKHLQQKDYNEFLKLIIQQQLNIVNSEIQNNLQIDNKEQQKQINLLKNDFKLKAILFNIQDASNTNLSEVIYEILYLLIQSIKHKKNITVKCNEGVSISSAIIIILLMTLYNASFREAFTYTRLKRRIIKPNIGFVTQILQWQHWRNCCAERQLKSQILSHFLKKYLNIAEELNTPIDSYVIKEQKGFKIGQNQSQYPADDEIKDVVNNKLYDLQFFKCDINWIFCIKLHPILKTYTVQQVSYDAFYDFLVRSEEEKAQRLQNTQVQQSPDKEFLFSKKKVQKQPNPINVLDDIYLTVFNGDFIYVIIEEQYVIEYQLQLSLTQKAVRYDQNYLFQNLEKGIENSPCYSVLKDQFIHQIYRTYFTDNLINYIIRAISLFVLFEGCQPNIIVLSKAALNVSNIAPYHIPAVSLLQFQQQHQEEDICIAELSTDPGDYNTQFNQLHQSQFDMSQSLTKDQRGRISLKRLPKRLSRLAPIIKNFNDSDNYYEIQQQNKWLESLEHVEDV